MGYTDPQAKVWFEMPATEEGDQALIREALNAVPATDLDCGAWATPEGGYIYFPYLDREGSQGIAGIIGVGEFEALKALGLLSDTNVAGIPGDARYSNDPTLYAIARAVVGV